MLAGIATRFALREGAVACPSDAARGDTGKGEGKAAAFARRRASRQAATQHRGGDAAADGEPQPGAPLAQGSGKEGIEDVGQYVGRHAATVVQHLQVDGLLVLMGPDLDASILAIPDAMEEGVVDQVEQHLAKGTRVAVAE